uniref:Uncharacterized protein n=1 Tax=Oryzias latipes TaxID=8090 RepID=A0A3P9JV81_ORYLA
MIYFQLFQCSLLTAGSRNDDGKVGSKQLTLAEATLGKCIADAESEMLAELSKFQKENMDSFCNLKSSLNRFENMMDELKQRLTEVEDRVNLLTNKAEGALRFANQRYYESGNRASKLLAFQLRKAQANRTVAKIINPSSKKVVSHPKDVAKISLSRENEDAQIN